MVGAAMKNPIYKRVFRELWAEKAKYLVLFLFLVFSIGFTSGYLVADGSMIRTYNKSFDKYAVENGHFNIAMKPGSDFNKIIDNLEQNQKITVQEQFYKEQEVTAGRHKGDTFRIYKDRKALNKISVLSGHLPKHDNEIAIDRLYAENNDIKIGDTIYVNGRKFKVSGLSAFSDYSAMFRNNADMMFDAQNFSVAVITGKAWDKLGDNGIFYSYAWRNKNQKLSEKAQKDKAVDVKDELLDEHAMLTDIVARPDNNAIMFTGNDFGNDMASMQMMLYIIMAVIAFIFAISARNGIEKESKTIGTLRATGYKRRELLSYYLMLPMIVSLVAAVTGNILGYSYLKGIIAKAYYHSYSLPMYTTYWNSEAFIKTTLVPIVIVFIVNVVVLTLALRTEPLQLLRGEVKSKSSTRNPVQLPNWKFISRFRARIILHNIGAYITLAIGILMASILMIYGTMFGPMLTHFKTDVQKSQIAKYQYVLKAPFDVKYDKAEKYAYSTLKNNRDEDVSIYGIEDNSRYFKGKLVNIDTNKVDAADSTSSEAKYDSGKKEIEVLASSGYMEKYRLKDGAKIKLHDKFGDGKYTFVLKRTYKYPSSLTLFMPIGAYNKVFGKDAGNYTGYFADKKLDEINKDYIASIITKQDLTLAANQLESSMGEIFKMFGAFACTLYLLFLYLLARSTIEKSVNSISLVKILGYSDGEIGKLYNYATGIVAISSLVISAFLGERIIRELFYYMMLGYSGCLEYYIEPKVYIEFLAIGIIGYLLISNVLMRQIKKIPMAIALKQAE
jgi:ABC-type transport system, involved in lipoprotein release, permease component